VRIRDMHGNAVYDAVVTVAPQSGGSVLPAPLPSTRAIEKKNETFIPYIEVTSPPAMCSPAGTLVRGGRPSAWMRS
jgi:hypothetical protein